MSEQFRTVFDLEIDRVIYPQTLMIINRSFNVAFLLSVAQQKSENLFLFFHELDQAVSDTIKIVGVEV